jgi:hypothetical protein
MRPQRELSRIFAVAIMLNCCGVKFGLTRNELFCDMLQGTHCTPLQHSMDTHARASFYFIFFNHTVFKLISL